jgi:hypothetical protein
MGPLGLFSEDFLINENINSKKNNRVAEFISDCSNSKINFTTFCNWLEKNIASFSQENLEAAKSFVRCVSLNLESEIQKNISIDKNLKQLTTNHLTKTRGDVEFPLKNLNTIRIVGEAVSEQLLENAFNNSITEHIGGFASTKQFTSTNKTDGHLANEESNGQQNQGRLSSLSSLKTDPTKSRLSTFPLSSSLFEETVSQENSSKVINFPGLESQKTNPRSR